MKDISFLRFSIITVNLNDARGLRRTVRSVVEQTCRDYEFIVIDGGSTDGSTDVLDEYRDNISYFVSERDSGIYNGMNKGILAARGEYILFLNSGDCFASKNVLEKVLQVANGSPDIMIGMINLANEGHAVKKDVGLRDDDISLFSLFLYGIPHQACFIKRNLFNGCLYDESLKINSDWKFFLQKIIMENCSYQIIPVTVADYDNSGISSTQTEKLLSERTQAFRELVPARIASDYEKVFPQYYEVYRVRWLLRHKFFYRMYRGLVSLGVKLLGQ